MILTQCIVSASEEENHEFKDERTEIKNKKSHKIEIDL